MAAITPVVVNSGDASVTFSAVSTGAADTITFADISTALPAAAANYRIKAFLDAARGSVALTVAALGSNGCCVSCIGSATSIAPFVSADKTLAGLAAGTYVVRISLSYSASN
jgi:hypothetical protein